jgi:hypothetical protein
MPVRSAVLTFAALAAGCSSMLPTSSSTIDGNWKSYAEAQQAFDAIKPHQTTLSELQALKLDPYTSSNVTVLNYADVARRFLPDSAAVSLTDLDVGIQSCISAKTACTGLKVHQTGTSSQRDGNFLADTLGFHRHTETLGWNFDGLILLKDDVVIYKLTGGQPVIHEHSDDRNPLGPLQGIAKKLFHF